MLPAGHLLAWTKSARRVSSSSESGLRWPVPFLVGGVYFSLQI